MNAGRAGRLASLLASARVAVRWSEWYGSKVPFVWTACAAAALASPLGDHGVILRTVGVIVFTCLCGAFGHFANDFADRECDLAAGKPTIAGRMDAAPATMVLVLLAVAALAALVLSGASPLAVAAGVATLALAAAYSLPPFRLKARGSAGIWSAAAAQRTLPVIVALTAVGRVDAAGWALLLLAQLVGTRWMLVHQTLDAENDRRTGVATWVSVAGERRASALVSGVVFPLELALLLLAIGLEASHTPVLWLLPVAGFVASGAWVWRCRGVQAPYSFDGYDSQPLAGFYQLIWPLGLSCALMLARPRLWEIGVALILWQHRYIWHQARRFVSRRAPLKAVPTA